MNSGIERFKGIRLALVGPLPPPSGGMANQTRQLAGLLADEGLQVELVQVNPPYRPAWVARLWGLRALFRLLPYCLAVWRATGRVQLVHVMANSGWAWHLFAAPAVWLARLRGVPVVINYRGGEAEAFFSRSWSRVRPTVSRADAVIVPSGFLEAVFGKRGIDTSVVPNIIDLSRFHAAPVFAQSDAPHVLVARNLEPIYDVSTALRAFALLRRRYPKARLSVAGSGPLRRELEQQARQLAIADAVTFTGRLDNAAMVELYRDAQLMLNPSLADNMPISILEALASGVPVVSTRVGGVPYLVEDGRSALLVPAQDFQAMAAAAQHLLEDAALARRLRDTGLTEIRNYAWSAVRERLFAVYSRVLNFPASLAVKSAP